MWILGVLGLLAGLAGWAFLHAVGPAIPTVLQQPEQLSPAARQLVQQALVGIDPARVVDHHAHLAGMGTHASGCELSSEHQSWLHPWKRLQTLAYMRAGGVRELEWADQQFAQRLHALVEAGSYPGRVVLLPFDRAYAENGQAQVQRTELVVPDAWVFEQSQSAAGRFVAALSVHPYRADAVQALEAGARRGARIVKWLPNTMGMDPADPRCDEFYKAMARLKLCLLSHAGEEQAVDARERQELGNPLRLRRALDHGVRVIIAHCASLGEFDDLDAPGQRTSSFALFARMMDDPKYTSVLYGELSATVFSNRDPAHLRMLLERPDWHPRLVNGSDWPLPAIRVLTDVRKLERAGLLPAETVPALEELQDYHPLLFDWVLKRSLVTPSGARFPSQVFYSRPELVGDR